MARENLSLLCWNINKKRNKETEEYLNCEADLYFIQEVGDNFEQAFDKKKYGDVSRKEKIGSCNCIIYKKDRFEVYKIIGEEKKELHCALDTVLFGEETQLWGAHEKDKLIKALVDFSEKDIDKRVCVAILQYKCIPSKPKIIVASCHVQRRLKESKTKSPKCDSIKDYAEQMLKELEELGKAVNYPVIAAGDFNCDILKDCRSKFVVPKYDPTIHRVVCSGGKGKPCIDFFAYINCGECTMIEVKNVHAEIVWPEDDDDDVRFPLKNLDRKNFPLHQIEHLSEEKSTLDKISSDHDPLQAELNIDEISSPIFHITYCNFKRNWNATVKYFDKLFPHPDLCIFQNVPDKSIVQKVCEQYNKALCPRLHPRFDFQKCTDQCFIVYDTGKFLVEVEKWTGSVGHIKVCICICKIECHSVTHQPTFQLAIFYNNGTPTEQKILVQSKFKFVSSKFVSQNLPVLMVGGFKVDLFRTDDQKIERHGFEVPEYHPTMYSITHPYTKSPVYRCCDFFTYKNYTDTQEKTTLKVDNVWAETINPPPNLITGPYHVNYDLYWNDHEATETLSATVTINAPPKQKHSKVQPKAKESSDDKL